MYLLGNHRTELCIICLAMWKTETSYSKQRYQLVHVNTKGFQKGRNHRPNRTSSSEFRNSSSADHLLSRDVIGFDRGNGLQELGKRQQLSDLADRGLPGLHAQIFGHHLRRSIPRGLHSDAKLDHDAGIATETTGRPAVRRRKNREGGKFREKITMKSERGPEAEPERQWRSSRGDVESSRSSRSGAWICENLCAGRIGKRIWLFAGRSLAVSGKI